MLALAPGNYLDATYRCNFIDRGQIQVSLQFRRYQPENVVDDIDGYSGATLRGAKVLSAIRDGLNRGVYSW